MCARLRGMRTVTFSNKHKSRFTLFTWVVFRENGKQHPRTHQCRACCRSGFTSYMSFKIRCPEVRLCPGCRRPRSNGRRPHDACAPLHPDLGTLDQTPPFAPQPSRTRHVASSCHVKYRMSVLRAVAQAYKYNRTNERPKRPEQKLSTRENGYRGRFVCGDFTPACGCYR